MWFSPYEPSFWLVLFASVSLSFGIWTVTQAFSPSPPPKLIVKPTIIQEEFELRNDGKEQEAGDETSNEDDDSSEDPIVVVTKSKNIKEALEKTTGKKGTKSSNFNLPHGDVDDAEGRWEVKKKNKKVNDGEKDNNKKRSSTTSKKADPEKLVALEEKWNTQRLAATAATERDRREVKVDEEIVQTTKKISQNQRAVLLRQKEEAEVRAAIAISIVEQQRRGHVVSPPNAMPNRQFVANVVDNNIADIQRNISALKQALHVGAESSRSCSNDMGFVGTSKYRGESAGQSVSKSHYNTTTSSPRGVTGILSTSPPMGASHDARTLVSLVGGELLMWLEPFHIRLEYVSRLPSSPSHGQHSSSIEVPDILIFFYEFPAGMGPIIAGYHDDKLAALQRGSGCIITINYDEEHRGLGGMMNNALNGTTVVSGETGTNVMRSGLLRIKGTIVTVPIFIKLFDTQMINSLEMIQTRQFTPRIKCDTTNGISNPLTMVQSMVAPVSPHHHNLDAGAPVYNTAHLQQNHRLQLQHMEPALISPTRSPGNGKGIKGGSPNTDHSKYGKDFQYGKVAVKSRFESLSLSPSTRDCDERTVIATSDCSSIIDHTQVTVAGVQQSTYPQALGTLQQYQTSSVNADIEDDGFHSVYQTNPLAGSTNSSDNYFNPDSYYSTNQKVGHSIDNNKLSSFNNNTNTNNHNITNDFNYNNNRDNNSNNNNRDIYSRDRVPESPEEVSGSCVVFFEVPEEHTGYVIGKQGFIIKSLMTKTGTFISLVSPNPVRKPNEEKKKKHFMCVSASPGMVRFIVKGEEDAVDLALSQFRRNLAKIDVDMVVLDDKDY